MNSKKKNNLKKCGTLALAGALLITGSLAWQDVTQHKTNSFATKSVAHSMVLVEDFEPVETWTLGQEIKKEVSVRNGQENDDTTRFVYTDGYVRLQLREFMGIANQTYVTHPDRLMIDTAGNFYRFENETDAKAKATELGLPADRIVGVKGVSDDKEYFYIKTDAGDLNGQYGKFLITDIASSELKSIVDGSTVTDLDKDVKDKHNSIDGSNQEDSNIYTTHVWSEGYSNFTPSSNKFSEYAEWNLGNDVISLQQWKSTYQSKPVAKWIVDTSDATNGYVYWGQRLNHATNANATSMTSNLLEKVTLIKQPEGHAEYRIHVNMDAVSVEDLSKWSNANSEIVGAYKNSIELETALKDLENAISRGEGTDLTGMTADTVKKLQDALEAGKGVYSDGESFLSEIKDATKAIEDALAGLKFDEKIRLEQMITKVSEDNNYKYSYFMNVEKMDNAYSAFSFAQDTLDNPESKDVDFRRAYSKLSDAYDEIKDDKGLGKLYENVYIAGRVFQYVKYDEATNSAIVQSAALSKKDFETMGLSDFVANPDDKYEYAIVTYSDSLNTAGKYEDSKVKTINQKFYETFIKSNVDALYVRPIKIVEGNALVGTSWKDRTDDPTLVIKDGSGVKDAFTLSITDFHETEYGSEIDVSKLNVPYHSWLRSKGNTSAQTVISKYNSTVIPRLDQTSTRATASVSPAMWVSVPTSKNAEQ